MTPQEQLNKCADEKARTYVLVNSQMIAKHNFVEGGLKGMEIQKEIDRQEIERLKKALEDIQMASVDYSNLSSWGNLAGMLDKINSNASDALKP